MILRLSNIVETAVNPALQLLPRGLDSTEARVMLLAIGLQESRFEYRRQIGGGPGRGYPQFEPGDREKKGGVWGVYLHPASNELLRLLCRDRDCNFDPRAIWSRLEDDDVLAIGLARLLLLTDPHPLPEIGDVQGAWGYYLRNWRPGKPRPESWPDYYAQAVTECVPRG